MSSVCWVWWSQVCLGEVPWELQQWHEVRMLAWAVNLPSVLCKARPAGSDLIAWVIPGKKCTCLFFCFVFQGLPSQKQGRSSQKAWGKQQCASRDSGLAVAHIGSKSALQNRTSLRFPCWSEHSKMTGKLALSEPCRAYAIFPMNVYWHYLPSHYLFSLYNKFCSSEFDFYC